MKKRIIIITFGILLILFVVPITYAIYKDIVLGNGNLTLATWDVTLNQSNVNNHLSIISEPNEMIASYKVKINSNSEVNIVYSIVVDNLSSGVSVSLDGVNYELGNNNKVVFSNIGTIPYNDATKSREHTVYFKAATNVDYVSNREVNINVETRQQL